jgi:hypothetical protein
MTLERLWQKPMQHMRLAAPRQDQLAQCQYRVPNVTPQLSRTQNKPLTTVPCCTPAHLLRRWSAQRPGSGDAVDVFTRAPRQHHELLLQLRGHGRSHQWMDLLCTGLWGPTQLLKRPTSRLGCWARWSMPAAAAMQLMCQQMSPGGSASRWHGCGVAWLARCVSNRLLLANPTHAGWRDCVHG